MPANKFDTMARLIRVLIYSMCLCVDYDAVNAFETTEYCNGELFGPKCSSDEIILMHYVKYGRMKLGKCLQNDLGYLGCNSDVLPQFDEQCSGKQSCEILVTDNHIHSSGGCMNGLQSYLEASYECVKGIANSHQCLSNARWELQSEEIYLSSDIIERSCVSNGRGLTLYTNEGQTVNISLININNNAAGSDEIYGTLLDSASGHRAVFGNGERERHIMTSVSNEVMLSSQSDSRFILHVTVSGCPNMSPPDGAWLTRDGEVMEIGCHTGAKSWSLKCQDNQWVGAVGQCGAQQESEIQIKGFDEKTDTASISPNVMVFGLASLVILISSIIFMSGVCILKSKLTPASRSNMSNLKLGTTYYGNTISSTRRNNQGGIVLVQQGNSMDAENKSLKAPVIDPVTGEGTIGRSEALMSPPGYGIYMNRGGLDASDSVTYYVLDDNKPT